MSSNIHKQTNKRYSERQSSSCSVATFVLPARKKYEHEYLQMSLTSVDADFPFSSGLGDIFLKSAGKYIKYYLSINTWISQVVSPIQVFRLQFLCPSLTSPMRVTCPSILYYFFRRLKKNFMNIRLQMLSFLYVFVPLCYSRILLLIFSAIFMLKCGCLCGSGPLEGILSTDHVIHE